MLCINGYDWLPVVLGEQVSFLHGLFSTIGGPGSDFI
jgi:hypothetical protein